MTKDQTAESAAAEPGEERCAYCGERIIYRRARGAYMHASSSIAACDLDSDHPPTPATEGAAPPGR